jgi:hypothetical protein
MSVKGVRMKQLRDQFCEAVSFMSDAGVSHSETVPLVSSSCYLQ